MSSVWRVIWMQGLICRQTLQMRNNLFCFLCSVLIVQKSVIIGHRLNMILFLLPCVTVIVLRSANIVIELQKIKLKNIDWKIVLSIF